MLVWDLLLVADQTPALLPQLPACLLPVFHPFLLGESIIFIFFPNAPVAGRII